MSICTSNLFLDLNIILFYFIRLYAVLFYFLVLRDHYCINAIRGIRRVRVNIRDDSLLPI